VSDEEDLRGRLVGRHARLRRSTSADAADRRQVDNLSGWGAFATVVAALFVAGADADLLPVGAVLVLGGISTAVLSWLVRRSRSARHRADQALPAGSDRPAA
jgi:Flp pilus assembly protein TadB